MLSWRVPSAATVPKRSLIAQMPNWIACSVNLPQSFSGFCCECACLKASRCGAVAVKSSSEIVPGFAANWAFLPAAARVVRVPSISGTVSVSRSCGAAPVPLSV
ncbi:hypothetical protein D3C72_1713010 [compost metagenome]